MLPERADEQFFPPELSFPVTALLRVLPDAGRPGGRPARMRHQLRARAVRSAGLVRHHAGRPARAAGNRPQHAAGVFAERSAVGKRGDDRTATSRPIAKNARPVHARALRAGQDSGADGARAVVEPADLDGNVQRPAQQSRRFARTISSGSTSIPRGEPFWVSAAQLRQDLAKVREVLDPRHAEPALDHMVLVGHSMGGPAVEAANRRQRRCFLAARSATIRCEDLKIPPADREQLAQEFYFRPNPSIRRVITIATPHRGSKFANSAAQWLAARLITMPEQIVKGRQDLYRENPGKLHESFAGGSDDQHPVAVARTTRSSR